jgi:hypothetical protein
MENSAHALKKAEEDMLAMANHVKPTVWGRWLGAQDAAAVCQLLRIGATALRINRLGLQEKDLIHFKASLEEEYHE